MNKSYLLTGGNMGNRANNLSRARELVMQHCGKVTAFSGLYETAAWGKTDQPSFLNQAIEIQTMLTPPELLESILDIEKRLGRLREEKYGPRLIDIDILLYDARVINTSTLKVPHPELPNRRFALKPLSEIAANIVHPLLGKTIDELLASCPDQLEVHAYTE